MDPEHRAQGATARGQGARRVNVVEKEIEEPEAPDEGTAEGSGSDEQSERADK